MTEQHPFKWRHFEAEIILLCVRWYLRYDLSYRDLEEIMIERGCRSTILPFSAGFSATRPNWRSAADAI
jgi:hypothetical protein